MGDEFQGIDLYFAPFFSEWNRDPRNLVEEFVTIIKLGLTSDDNMRYFWKKLVQKRKLQILEKMVLCYMCFCKTSELHSDSTLI